MQPVPEIHPVIIDALASKPDHPPMTVVYGLLASGVLTETDIEVWERLTAVGTKKPPKQRAVRTDLPPYPSRVRVKIARTNRRERCAKRAINFHGRYIRRQSLAPTLDGRLSSGAVRTLNYIIARTGRKALLETMTNWIANDLGFCSRTIRVHLRTLDAAGYIWRSNPDPQTGKIKLAIRVGAEVPVWVVLKNAAELLAAFEGMGRNPDSATHEINSLDSLEESQPSSHPESDRMRSEDQGALLVGPAAPPDHPLGVKGDLTDTAEGTDEKPRQGRTVAGHSAEPIRSSDPESEAFNHRMDEILARVGASPANRPGERTLSQGRPVAPARPGRRSSGPEGSHRPPSRVDRQSLWVPAGQSASPLGPAASSCARESLRP